MGGGPGRPPKKLSSKESVSSGGPASHESESDNESTTTGCGGSGMILKPGEPDHFYTAPQWLLHEKQTPKFFSIPLPSVHPSTLHAIQQLRKPESSNQRKLREQANQALDTIRQLEAKRKIQTKKIKHHTEKLSAAMARKEKAIEEIRTEKERELNILITEMETRVRKEEEIKFVKIEEDMKQEIKEKFERDFEANRIERKRKREEDRTREKEISLEKKRQEKLESGDPTKEVKSESLRIKVEELQAKLDKLQEKRSEMFWLLKEVIKADAKGKVELLKLQKKEAAAAAAASTGS